jgi:hypothetical protein
MELSDFLMTLSEDPSKAAALKERPQEVLDEAGLSQEDKDLLLSRDPVAIHRAVRRSAEEQDNGVTIVIVVIV